MKKGTVKFYNPTKGFGFIATSKGDIFFHISNCYLKDIKENDNVIFDTTESNGKISATRVCKIADIEEVITILYDNTFSVSYFCGTNNVTDLLPTPNYEINIEFVRTETIYNGSDLIAIYKFTVGSKSEEKCISDIDFILEHNPELEKDFKDFEEKKIERRIQSEKKYIEKLKNDKSIIKQMIEETHKVFNVEFPKTLTFDVENVYFRNELHYDITKGILEIFIYPDEDIFISSYGIESSDEDDSYETNEELKALYKESSKLLYENRKLFNTVFEKYLIEVIVKDLKGDEFRTFKLQKDFEEDLSLWLIDWKEAIYENDLSLIRRDIDWLENKDKWNI